MQKRIFTILALSFIGLNVLLSGVQAQVQEEPFSGNDASSYQCLDKGGNDTGDTIIKDSTSGYYLCSSTGERATLKPPTLQQLEFWFVRIIYVIWGFVGAFSFFFLVYLGYQFMLKQDTTDSQLVDLRRRILNFAIGFALVFLAIPILSTFFRVLGINTNVDCYNVNMPGFQFFFANLCTDPKGVITSNPCSGARGSAVGFACDPATSQSATCTSFVPSFCYTCIASGAQAGTWQLRVGGSPECN
jgi:hypothetical protein